MAQLIEVDQWNASWTIYESSWQKFNQVLYSGVRSC
jgi:hypothetical protein